MTEEWRPVVGYEGLYEVSDLGRVRSLPRLDTHNHLWKGQELKQAGTKGYRQVTLCRAGHRQSCRVHALVLSAFVGPCPPGMEGAHGDRDPSNNRLQNLRWDTPIGNQADRVPHGTHSRGSKNPIAKLTEADVDEIFRLRREGCTLQQIADVMPVKMGAVHHVLSGRSWKHVERPQ